MIPDGYIHDRRVRALRELPFTLPATVVMQMRDTELDYLGAAGREEHPHQYEGILSAILRRIESKRAA